jgi:ATP-dependent DNA helicase Rep
MTCHYVMANDIGYQIHPFVHAYRTLDLNRQASCGKVTKAANLDRVATSHCRRVAAISAQPVKMPALFATIFNLVMSRLNPRQQEAVSYVGGPLLVLAGAGSGKTSVITRKIAHLIQNCGIRAQYIVAMTFTNKAAREMKERVGTLLKKGEGRGLTCQYVPQPGAEHHPQGARAAGLQAGLLDL